MGGTILRETITSSNVLIRLSQIPLKRSCSILYFVGKETLHKRGTSGQNSNSNRFSGSSLTSYKAKQNEKREERKRQ